MWKSHHCCCFSLPPSPCVTQQRKAKPCLSKLQLNQQTQPLPQEKENILWATSKLKELRNQYYKSRGTFKSRLMIHKLQEKWDSRVNGRLCCCFLNPNVVSKTLPCSSFELCTSQSMNTSILHCYCAFHFPLTK